MGRGGSTGRGEGMAVGREGLGEGWYVEGEGVVRFGEGSDMGRERGWASENSVTRWTSGYQVGCLLRHHPRVQEQHLVN